MDAMLPIEARGTPEERAPGRSRAPEADEGGWRSVAGGLTGDRHVRGLQALLALFDVELDLVAFVQVLVPVSLDRREVNEHVGGAVALFDEAEAFFGAEPLDLACRHSYLFPTCRAYRPRHPSSSGRWPGTVPNRSPERLDDTTSSDGLSCL